MNAMFLSSAESTAEGFNFVQMLPLLGCAVLLIVVMYFFAIRPQKKREKEEAAMRNSLDIGDAITTIGGLTGRIIAVNDPEDEVIIETGSNKSRISIKRWAIQGRAEDPKAKDVETEDGKTDKKSK